MSDISLDGEKALAWARVYAAVHQPHSKNLRHGTWYAVVRDDRPDRVTLRVGSQRIDVPRNLVEIRDKRPPYFTIVDTIGAPPKASDTLGKHYLVCPTCAKRSELRGHPHTSTCKECGYEGEVAWWE
jgi:hypothetical protein